MNGSSVSLGLLRSIIVVFLSIVNNLDSVSILPSSVRFFTLLVSDERLSVINIIEFSISETDMVSLIKSSPYGSE